MLLSLAYRLVRCLFGLLAALVRSHLSKDAKLFVLLWVPVPLENRVTMPDLGYVAW